MQKKFKQFSCPLDNDSPPEFLRNFIVAEVYSERNFKKLFFDFSPTISYIFSYEKSVCRSVFHLLGFKNPFFIL